MCFCACGRVHVCVCVCVYLCVFISGRVIATRHSRERDHMLAAGSLGSPPSSYFRSSSSTPLPFLLPIIPPPVVLLVPVTVSVDSHPPSLLLHLSLSVSLSLSLSLFLSHPAQSQPTSAGTCPPTPTSTPPPPRSSCHLPGGYTLHSVLFSSFFRPLWCCLDCPHRLSFPFTQTLH